MNNDENCIHTDDGLFSFQKQSDQELYSAKNTGRNEPGFCSDLPKINPGEKIISFYKNWDSIILL